MCRKASGAHRSTPTVRGLCYQLLGKLALLFPVDVSNEEVYVNKRLFNSATADLRQQVGRADRQDTANVKEQLGVVAGALTALDGLLSDTDDLRLPEIDVVWSQLLRCLAINVGEIKRFNAPKAALELLGHRIDLFACVEQWTPPPGTASAAVEVARLGQSRLLAATPGADGRPADGAELAAVALWRHLLALSTHHNRNLRLLATEVLGIFLRRTCAQVCDAAELAADADAAVVQRARTIYGFLRGEVRRLAQRPPAELDAAELSTLLSAVGELAGPMRRFDGEAEVHTQLRALCELAAAVYQPAALRHSEAARRGADRGATSISAFVEAFARVLRHVGGGAVDALALRTLEQLVQLTFAQFKMMTVGQRLRNAAALQEVLVALDGRDGAQGALLSRAVFPALLVTIDGGRSAAHPPPAVFVKGFWTPLLSAATRRHDLLGRGRATPRDGDLPPAERRERRLREAACGRVLEHVLRAIVRMLRRLNLSALTRAEPDEDDDGDGAAAGEAAADGGDGDGRRGAAGGGRRDGGGERGGPLALPRADRVLRRAAAHRRPLAPDPPRPPPLRRPRRPRRRVPARLGLLQARAHRRRRLRDLRLL